jgi:hypothetical protein
LTNLEKNPKTKRIIIKNACVPVRPEEEEIYLPIKSILYASDWSVVQWPDGKEKEATVIMNGARWWVGEW